MKYQTIVAGCVLAGLVALGGVGTTTDGFPWVRHARATAQTQEPASTPGPLGQRELPDFTALVEQNGSAVVHISVTRAMQPATDRRDSPEFPENDPFFEFFRRRGWFLLRRFLLLVRFFFEISLQITDAQFSPIEIRVPIESRRLHGAVAAVGSVNRMEDQRAIFHRAADGAEFVHAPRERHCSGARDEAERWPQACAAAARRRRGN